MQTFVIVIVTKHCSLLAGQAGACIEVKCDGFPIQAHVTSASSKETCSSGSKPLPLRGIFVLGEQLLFNWLSVAQVLFGHSELTITKSID